MSREGVSTEKARRSLGMRICPVVLRAECLKKISNRETALMYFSLENTSEEALLTTNTAPAQGGEIRSGLGEEEKRTRPTHFRKKLNSLVTEEEGIGRVIGERVGNRLGDLRGSRVLNLVLEELKIAHVSPEGEVVRGILDNNHDVADGEQEKSELHALQGVGGRELDGKQHNCLKKRGGGLPESRGPPFPSAWYCRVLGRT